MEFRLLLKETNLGVPVETAFHNMLLRVPSEDLKIVMSAFSIQRNVGGNLADIMDQVAAMIRQRIADPGPDQGAHHARANFPAPSSACFPSAWAPIIALINYDYMSKLWTPRVGDNLPFIERYLGPHALGRSAFSWSCSAASSSTKFATSRSNAWIRFFLIVCACLFGVILLRRLRAASLLGDDQHQPAPRGPEGRASSSATSHACATRTRWARARSPASSCRWSTSCPSFSAR